MKNTYLIAGVIVIIALLAFTFGRKTEAPNEKNEKMEAQNTLSGSVNAGFSAGKYVLDTDSSKLLWEGEYLTGLKENGTVNFSSGEVVVENGAITKGNFVIDMDTIESIPHKDRLVEHLKSDDFFGVTNYPTGTFVLKSMNPSSEAGATEGRYVIAGDLTVRGITKPVSFTATVTSDDEGNMYAKGSFALNRAEWEIKYNSSTFFSNLGDKVIRDAITIGLDLKAKKVIQ